MQVTLMSENGDTREDLTLPKGTEESEKLADQIKADFSEGKELIVRALGREVDGVCLGAAMQYCLPQLTLATHMPSWVGCHAHGA